MLDATSLLLIASYLGLSLIPVIYNHIRTRKTMPVDKKRNVAASMPPLQHNIVIVLNNIGEQEIEPILKEIELITRKISVKRSSK